MSEKRDLSAIGLEILYAARNELYMNLPYLDVALCALSFRDGAGVTLSIATDGENRYYDPAYLSEPGVSPHHPPLYAAAPAEKAGEGAGAVGPKL